MLFARLIVKHPSGRTALHAEDLALDGIEGEVFRLGTKFVLPKHWVDRFHSLAVRGRQIVERWTHTSPSSEAAYGGTWRAISPAAIEPLEDELFFVGERFDMDRERFLESLEAIRLEQRAAWQNQVRAVAEARADRGERLDIYALEARAGAAYDAAFERVRRKLSGAFRWDLLYCTIEAPNMNGQTETVTSEALRRSLDDAKEQFDLQMADVRHEITQAIRTRVAEKLQAISDRVAALRSTGASLSANVLKGLATELQLAKLTNPFGDADLSGKIEEFQRDWLQGRDLKEVAEEARTDGTNALKLQASVDRMLGYTQELLDIEEKAQALRTMGTAATEGKRRIR